MTKQATRLNHFQEGIFSAIERKVVAYQKQGREISISPWAPLISTRPSR